MHNDGKKDVNYVIVKHEDHNSEVDEPQIAEVEAIQYNQEGHIQIKRWGQHERNRGWIVLRGILITICVDMLLLIAFGGLYLTTLQLRKNAAAAEARGEGDQIWNSVFNDACF